MKVTVDNSSNEYMAVIDIKRVDDTAKIPVRGSADAAGYDLYAHLDMEELTIMPHETVKIGTGICVSIPRGYFGAIFARSGIAIKRSLRPANSVGVVDSDYVGEIIVALHNDSEECQTIQNGERIAQLVVIPFLPVEFNEVEELEQTERGISGFGSTGEK